ncbi:MAG: hypothetical protein R3B13_16380 [Polyangiaceae bacterium]
MTALERTLRDEHRSHGSLARSLRACAATEPRFAQALRDSSVVLPVSVVQVTFGFSLNHARFLEQWEAFERPAAPALSDDALDSVFEKALRNWSRPSDDESGTYWEGGGALQAEYDALWKRLAPREGAADTAQGEMIRCVGRLAREYYQNGNMNWLLDRDFYITFAAYIERVFRGPEGGAFASDGIRWVRAVRAVCVYEAEMDHFDADPFDRLIHAVVRWCLEHPEPLPVGKAAH